jgi:hypothetical protein
LFFFLEWKEEFGLMFPKLCSRADLHFRFFFKETSSWTVPPLVRDSFSMVRFPSSWDALMLLYEICFLLWLFCVNAYVVLPWQIGSAVGGTTGAFYGFNHGMLMP